MKIVITAPAKERLKRIYHYHKINGNGKLGRQIRVEVHSKSKQLLEFPNMGQIEIHLKHLQLGHRYLTVKPYYKIIYRSTETHIYITDVFDTRQDVNRMIP